MNFKLYAKIHSFETQNYKSFKAMYKPAKVKITANNAVKYCFSKLAHSSNLNPIKAPTPMVAANWNASPEYFR